MNNRLIPHRVTDKKCVLHTSINMICAQNAEEEFVYTCSYYTAIEFMLTPNVLYNCRLIVSHFYIRHCLCSVKTVTNLGLKQAFRSKLKKSLHKTLAVTAREDFNK